MEVTLDALTGSKSKQINPTIKEYFENYIVHLKQSGKINAAIKYKFTLSSLLKYCGDGVKIASIDKLFLLGFEQYLLGVGNAGNSIATKMSVLKALYNKALKDGVPVMKEHPFLDYNIGKLITPTRKRALTKDMIKRLIDLELPKSLSPYQELSRDIFLFSYYTAGINFKDIALLRYCDIEEGRICYRRRKTRKVINCLLIEPAKVILEKYTHKDHSPDDYIFPILKRGMHLTEQQINDRVHKALVRANRFLKQMSKQLGLSTPITTYYARHSFATVLKRSGVNIAIISESLGHSDLSTTQIYLDSFENSQIDEAMKNLL